MKLCPTKENVKNNVLTWKFNKGMLTNLLRFKFYNTVHVDKYKWPLLKKRTHFLILPKNSSTEQADNSERCLTYRTSNTFRTSSSRTSSLIRRSIRSISFTGFLHQFLLQIRSIFQPLDSKYLWR